MKRIPNAFIRVLLDEYNDLPLECDGFTRIATYILTRAGVAHKVMRGAVSAPDNQGVAPHYWIELPDGRIVDYRARMWLGPRAPHGVFKPPRGYTYHGHESALSCGPVLFKMLTEKVQYSLPGGE